ncbi:MAG: two pore domain potassium channel family protein [Butyrivibrio sp.]|nr:two pore domain potassium channel family protein [Butyrivibrio sp.]
MCYGDYYPVTNAGRLIASIFVILGIGLLARVHDRLGCGKFNHRSAVVR